MPRKPISPTETKREKFLRLATQRTKEILTRLRILGNCADRQRYEYTEADIRKIFSAIDEQLKIIKAKFAKVKEKDFKL
jgi:hypothetical protein